MEKLLDFFDGIFDIMVSPEKSFRTILDEKSATQGIFVFIFFAAFLGIMAGALIAGFVRNAFLPILFAILFIIYGLVKLLIWAGISHLIAKFVFKGEGNFVNTFGLFGYTSVASILGIFGIMTLMIATTIFTSAMLWGLMYIWTILIGTVAVNAEHKIGIGKSFLSCFGVPSLVVIFVFMILGVL
jgi:hypothetical protein